MAKKNAAATEAKKAKDTSAEATAKDLRSIANEWKKRRPEIASDLFRCAERLESGVPAEQQEETEPTE